jgi:hypothetical protein
MDDPMTRKLSVVAGLILLAVIAYAVAAGTRAGAGTRLNTIALDLVTASGAYQERAYLITLAEQQLVQRCMAGQNYTYWPATPEPIADPIDLPRRRAHGYGLNDPGIRPPAAGPEQDKPAFQHALSGSPEHYRQITLPDGEVLGFPTTGCLAQARATLYGDDTTWARTDSVPQILGSILRMQTRQDPALVRANQQWAECMKQAGFAFDSPAAAVASLATNHPREREIAVATADGQCQLQVGLPATDLAARRAAAASLPATQRQQLLDLGQAHCAAYRRAAPLTGHAKTPCG